LIIVQTLSNGGVEKVASIIANNLNSEVKIILYENKVIYKNNLKKIILDSPPSSNYLFKFIRFIKRVWDVRKIKNTENPDYVISFSDGPNLVNILSKTKEKVIISIHNNKSNRKGEVETDFLKRDNIKNPIDQLEQVKRLSSMEQCMDQKRILNQHCIVGLQS